MFQSLVVSVTLGLLICNAAHADDDELLPKRAKRFSGYRISLNSFPTVVSIIYEKRHICSGTILAEYLVMTAAHCITGKWTEKLVVHVEQRSVVTKYPVISLDYHNRFDSVNFTNDVGILRTQRPIILNNIIRPVTLPNRPTWIPTGSSVTYLSWASIFSGRKHTNEQRISDNLTVISNSECAELWGDIEENSLDSQFCANLTSSPDNFIGDTGGPLMYDQVQIGIISSSECGKESVPEISTNVSAVLDWIDQAKHTLMQAEAGLNPFYELSKDEKDYYENWYGIIANETEVPWLVALADKHNGVLECVGSIINENLVLTSAQCANKAKESTKVYVGKIGDEFGVEEHTIVKHHVHDEYNGQRSRYLHDLALLRVEPEFTWSHFVQPIKMIKNDDDLRTGEIAHVHGFVKGSGPRYLKLNVINDDECNWLYRRQGGLLKGQICAKSRFGMCAATIGAPLIVKGHIAGVLSKIDKNCHDYRFPGTYMRIVDNAAWISRVKSWISERDDGGLRR
ncbi:hypothetical protein QAD02_006943 [Eretmocerus hayati]|uniref:Uncharacterized protein n=1 Tax=Eretmocerus hayati TaxID=131215 RepID=A0ACC2N337_9HYME|nr:hypothetical protein QAD02_006943 [Eretmocerus hayati]